MGGGGESGFLVERCIGEVVGAGRSLSIGGVAAGHAHSAAASACTATMRHVTIPPCIFVSVAGKYSRRSGSPALSTSPMQSSEPRKYFATPSLPPPLPSRHFHPIFSVLRRIRASRNILDFIITVPANNCFISRSKKGSYEFLSSIIFLTQTSISSRSILIGRNV